MDIDKKELPELINESIKKARRSGEGCVFAENNLQKVSG